MIYNAGFLLHRFSILQCGDVSVCSVHLSFHVLQYKFFAAQVLFFFQCGYLSVNSVHPCAMKQGLWC